MPLPLLFLGIAAVSGATGIGKTIKAGVDNSTAKSITDDANQRMEKASKKLNKAREQCGDALECLGKEKLYILDTSIKEFVELFEKIKNVEFIDSVGLDEINEFRINKDSFKKLKEMKSFAASLMSGSAAGAAGGALAAFGAYSAATTFASASTGTAIASLSGAAATNATLAFFGGGSLAAGGLGVAGGTAVLGGLVAGPALLVMGVITGAKAGKNLEEARKNAAKAREICEQLENGTIQCIAIRRRTYMFYNLLARLDAYFVPVLFQLQQIIKEEGTNYQEYSNKSRSIIASAATMAGTIKAILDTAILTENGNLTNESQKMMENSNKYIDSITV